MRGNWKSWALGLLVAIVAVSPALGDIPRPPPKPSIAPKPATGKVEPKVVSTITSAVNVEHVDLSKHGNTLKAKIIIPKKLLAGNEALKDVAPAKAAPESGASFDTSRSLIAGIALSLAAVSAIFVRRGSKATKVAVGVVMVSAALLVGGTLWADIRIPGQPYRGPARRPAEEPVKPEAVNVVTIEIVEEGDVVTLQLPLAKPTAAPVR